VSSSYPRQEDISSFILFMGAGGKYSKDCFGGTPLKYSTLKKYIGQVCDMLNDVESGRGVALRRSRQTILLLAALKRRLGNDRVRARVLTVDEIRLLATAAVGDSLASLVFRFVVLVSFFGGFRLGAAMPADEPHEGMLGLDSFRLSDRGSLIVCTNFSKTNQHKERRRMIELEASPQDPSLDVVGAYLDLLAAAQDAGIAPDALLCEISPRVSSFADFVALCQMVLPSKVAVVGEKPHVTGHSWRRSFVHHALEAGFDLADIMVHGDWSHTESLVESYAVGAVLPSVKLASVLAPPMVPVGVLPLSAAQDSRRAVAVLPSHLNGAHAVPLASALARRGPSRAQAAQARLVDQLARLDRAPLSGADLYW